MQLRASYYSPLLPNIRYVCPATKKPGTVMGWNGFTSMIAFYSKPFEKVY